MIPEPILPLVRRAILDLLNDAGGEQTDDAPPLLPPRPAPRAARRDIGAQLDWLAERGLVAMETLGPFRVARILADGRDIAEGRLTVDGVWRHKTGD